MPLCEKCNDTGWVKSSMTIPVPDGMGNIEVNVICPHCQKAGDLESFVNNKAADYFFKKDK